MASISMKLRNLMDLLITPSGNDMKNVIIQKEVDGASAEEFPYY